MHRLAIALVCIFLCAPMFGDVRDSEVFILAGEPVRFDSSSRPRYSRLQVASTSDATRIGLARWAATGRGRELIDWFRRQGCQIVVIEDPFEPGIGRAPQPSIATLVAAFNNSGPRLYQLILNPSFFKVPEGMHLVFPNQPSTPADMMTVAWAGELLHIYFYARGISLPHHPRHDFQQQWFDTAIELGMPGVLHGGDEDAGALEAGARGGW